jgi:hypothetical protein
METKNVMFSLFKDWLWKSFNMCDGLIIAIGYKHGRLRKLGGD